MTLKQLSEKTWTHPYMGIKNIHVNHQEYTISAHRKSDCICVSYSFISGSSYELYYALGCTYDFVMKDIKYRIKRRQYAKAYYCTHSETGFLQNCIIF